MTNPEPFKEEQYNEAFDAIKASADAAPKDGEVLVVHMWEWLTNLKSDYSVLINPSDKTAIQYNDCINDPQARKLHFDEMGSLLGVMGNEPKASYNDRKYGWNTRKQTSQGHGAIAVACTGVSAEHSTTLFSSLCPTGLLLQNPTPIYASHDDVCSIYQEPRFGQGIGKLEIRDGPIPKKSKLIEEIDPLSPEAEARAREEYKEVMQPNKYIKDYNEVCVNATLKHAAGIVITQHFSTAPHSEDEWRESLASDKHLCHAVRVALEDNAFLTDKLQEHGIDRVPTIVIYDARAKNPDDRFIHFPPIQKNIDMVNEIGGFPPIAPESNIAKASLVERLTQPKGRERTA